MAVRGAVDSKNPPPTLAEQYECAAVTSDLGLPHGDAAGAQGILAAAAWTEVHLGSALRRLRIQWENARPRKKTPRAYELLKAGGMTRVQAKRQHNRELVQCALTYSREKKALKLRIPEYAQVLEVLLTKAVVLGIEEPEAKAIVVLDRWLENPQRAPESLEEARLWQYIQGCVNEARVALTRGMRGQTNSHPG
jgi:hypothetical protein